MILTYAFRRMEYDKLIIGIVMICYGGVELIEFITYRHLEKLRNIPNAVISGLMIVFGTILLLVDLDMEQTCILLGAVSIGFHVIKIANNAFNVPHDPLLKIIKIVLSIIEIVLCVILIIRREASLEEHMIFIAISLLIEAILTTIEVVRDHNQKN